MNLPSYRTEIRAIETHVVLRPCDSGAAPSHGVSRPDERPGGGWRRLEHDLEHNSRRVGRWEDASVERTRAGDDHLELAVGGDHELGGIDWVAEHGGACGADDL